MKLTIGMAVYNDLDGVYFTVQSLRMYHAEPLRECELVVVDNNPDSEHGKAVKSFMSWVKGDFAESRYVPFTAKGGTAAPRQHIFDAAKGDAVLCMDSHVLLWQGALAGLLAYYEANPDSKDILSGPMVYDGLRSQSTHFDDVWRGEMWGTWGTDKRADDPDAPPFEIPAMGLGLFTCRKDAWRGFNPRFRGFGGEEFYIHEKFRQAGGKALCLPFLKWVHRFQRPEGVKYRLTRSDKAWNYIVGHLELGLDVEKVKDHFCGSEIKMPEREFDALVREVKGEPKADQPAKKTCGGCNKKDAAAAAPQSIATHETPALAKIAELASDELLVVDGFKNAAAVFRALTEHASNFKRAAIRWTAPYGEIGEDGGPGLLAGVRRWLKDNPDWTVFDAVTEVEGLLVLTRDPKDKQPLPGTIAQTWNFTKATGRAVAAKVHGKTLLLTDDAVQQRLNVCLLCPLRNKNKCGMCGCALDGEGVGIPGKALLATESCPVGKWEAIP